MAIKVCIGFTYLVIGNLHVARLLVPSTQPVITTRTEPPSFVWHRSWRSAQKWSTVLRYLESPRACKHGVLVQKDSGVNLKGPTRLKKATVRKSGLPKARQSHEQPYPEGG